MFLLNTVYYIYNVIIISWRLRKGKKRREKQDMRNLIIESATGLFLKLGYDKTSIRSIAEDIEYSPATIYLYFKESKHRERRELGRGDVEALGGDEPGDAERGAVEDREDVDQHPDDPHDPRLGGRRSGRCHCRNSTARGRALPTAVSRGRTRCPRGRPSRCGRELIGAPARGDEPGGSQRDEPLGLGLQRRHPLLALESGSGPDVEVHAVLGGLGSGTCWKNSRGPARRGRLTPPASLQRSAGAPGVQGLVPGVEAGRAGPAGG